MKPPSAKAIRAAATSVAGARSMGIETAASKAAPALLSSAHEWLRAEEDGAQFDARWQIVSEAAAELARALGVKTRSEIAEERAAERRSAAAAMEYSREAARAAEEEAAKRREQQAWKDFRAETAATRGDLRDSRGMRVAIVRNFGESVALRGDLQQVSRTEYPATCVAQDGRVLPRGEWLVSADDDQQFIVAADGVRLALTLGGYPATSATSEWLPSANAGSLYVAGWQAEQVWEDLFKERSEERRQAAKNALQHPPVQSGAMAAAFAALRRQ